MSRRGLFDSSNGYGVLSICLHWLTAIAVIALLYIGATIPSSSSARYRLMVDLHTTVAAFAYLGILIRIVWRVRSGHPGPSPGQRTSFFKVAKFIHWAMLAIIGLMLISGPVLGWASGSPIRIAAMASLPSPFGVSPELVAVAHSVHANGAIALALGVLLHVAAAIKRLIFDRDTTFERILVANGSQRR